MYSGCKQKKRFGYAIFFASEAKWSGMIIEMIWSISFSHAYNISMCPGCQLSLVKPSISCESSILGSQVQSLFRFGLLLLNTIISTKVLASPIRCNFTSNLLFRGPSSQLKSGMLVHLPPCYNARFLDLNKVCFGLNFVY